MSVLDVSRVAWGSIYLSLRTVLTTVIGVLGFSVMARYISQSDMGVYTALTLLASSVQLISGFGFPSAIVKFVSELIGRGEDYSPYVLSALTLRFALTLALSLILIIFSGNLSQFLFKSYIYTDLIILVLIDSIITSISTILNNFLWGYGSLAFISIVGVASTLIRWSTILIFLLNDYGLTGVIYGWLMGDISTLTLLTLKSIHHLSFSREVYSNFRPALKRLIQFSWPLYISSIISYLYNSYDKFLVLAYLPLSDLGVYNVAYTAFSILVSLASSIGASLYPYYGRLYGADDHKTISLSISHSSKYVMLLLSPLILGLASTSKPIITLFAGPNYTNAWTILSILSIFGLVYSISPAFTGLLLIYNKTKTILIINLASILISLTLLPSTKLFGLNALAIVKGSSILISFTLTLTTLSKIIKIELEKQTLTKILTASTIMALTVTTIQQFTYNPILLPIYILIGGATYLTLIKLFKIIDKNDLLLLKQIIGEKYTKLIEKIML
ncbi:MAG: polysaccharide biosynthesis protein [Desulfurococcales archaeon]|nr:polysaccharide biosynthesis protein [Desulfurococcales archaeon]